MTIRLTDHVVERYIERVRPVTEEAARAELDALLKLGEIGDRPDWLPPWYEAVPGQRYVEISDGICVALVPATGKASYLATTLMCRGGRSEEERRARRRKRRERRKQQRGIQEFKDASGRRNKRRVQRQIEEAMNER